MATINSTMYTIGTALRRAQDADISVDLLVAGQWLTGRVSATDGQGVMLRGEGDDVWIIRLSGIEAVRVREAAAFEGRIELES